MDGFYGMAMARDRQDDLLREAEERRLARRLRRAREERVNGCRKPLFECGIVVRWGLAEDEPGVAGLLELNGMPRWVAFEERFLVAEEDGRVLGALSYRTESKRLTLGTLVVDPWAGERRVAGVLYTRAGALAVDLGAGEVLAESPPRASYVREAGYRRRRRVWRLETARSEEGRGRSLASVWRRTSAVLRGLFRR